MILYLKDLLDSTRKLDLVHLFSKVAGYKIYIQKLVTFLYTNKLLKKETEEIFFKSIQE